MKTDMEIRLAGMDALFHALGDVDAEKFVTLMNREPFDYTKWQRSLWADRGLAEVSAAAMKHRKRKP